MCFFFADEHLGKANSEVIFEWFLACMILGLNAFCLVNNTRHICVYYPKLYLFCHPAKNRHPPVIIRIIPNIKEDVTINIPAKNRIAPIPF